MKRLCVFCGSHPGSRPDYLQAAEQLGQLLAQRQLTVVYGGVSVGLMGHLARAALEAGGHVIGVIPRVLVERELAYMAVSEVRVVASLAERKAVMAELADGFIALPGGLGTLDELFEVLTWGQLGFHCKPCGLLNVGEYYRLLLNFLDMAVGQGFIRPEHRAMLLHDLTAEGLLQQFERYQATAVGPGVIRR